MKKLLILVLCNSTFAMNSSDFVELLQENHPFFALQQQAVNNLGVAKNIANSYQGWNLHSQITGNQHNTTSDNYFSPSVINSLSNTSINGDSTTISNTLAKNSLNSSQYSNNIAISYTVPLAKNASGINNKLQFDVATFNETIGYLQYSIDTSKFITNNLKSFWQLKFLSDKLKVNKQKLTAEHKQLQLLQEKLASNLVDISDVLLQENDYQDSAINVEETLQEFRSLKHELQKRIGSEITTVMLDLDHLTSVKEDVDLGVVRSIKILDLQLQKKRRELQSLINKEKSQIDLNLGLSTTKTGDSMFTTGESDNVISAGLTIALPLGSKVNQDLILQKQNEISIIKLTKDEQMIELRNAYTTTLEKIKSLQKVLNINQKQLVINKNKTAEFEKMYENGNTELRFVIDAKNKEYSSKLSYYANLLNYQHLILDYQQIIQ